MAIYDMASAIRQPDAGNFGQGMMMGQQIAQNRRANQARNALARLAQGDQTALPELMQADPEAGMKWQEMQRAEETRTGLQGFFKPATGATNVIGVNSLAALANPQPAQPAGYDFDGAMNYAASRGEIEKATSLAALRDKMRPQSAKYYGGDAQEVIGQDGKRRLIAMTEAGPVELPYQPVSKPKYKFMDDGTVVDETTATPVGRIPVGLSPAQKIQWMQFNASQSKPQLVQTDAGFEWVVPGQAPVGKPKPASGGATTEDAKKAAGYAKRMDLSIELMDKIVADGASATGGANEVFSRGLDVVGLGNFVRSPDNQRLEAARLDALDAALTLNTGAAYTKEQLVGLSKSYFPQPGDSDQTVIEKAARFKNVVDTARIRAGQMGADGRQSTSGQDSTKSSAYREYLDAFNRAKTNEQRNAITERARKLGVVK